jgi:two-component system, OmpR family, sensor histidine kinase KdpD
MWIGYLWALAATVSCTVAGLAMRTRFDLVNVAMVYLLAVVFVALRYSRGPAIATAVLCVATFDYIFVPPRGAFTVDDVQYLFTFGIMLAVALVISHLVESVRQQARKQAALAVETETERIRSALLASISHDLRTPLAVMAGASSTLAEAGDRLTREEREGLVKSVLDQSRKMSERVAKVLQMTRLETGAIKLERDWTDVNDIVSSVLTRLKERMASHRVLTEISPGLPLLRVDAALIEQALGNLLENAARHTPLGTVVRLRAQVRDDEMVISVEDLGGGLADTDVERVFEKFSRGSVDSDGTGMGLGLAICRAIIRLHGGRAWAQQIPAGGTAFRFTLPLEKPPVTPPEVVTS